MRVMGVLLAVIISLSAAQSLEGGAKDSSTSLTLRHTNIITGHRIAATDVIVPVDSTFAHTPFGPNESIKVTGEGRLAGILLLGESEKGGHRGFFAARYRRCATRQCRSKDFESWQQTLVTHHLRERADKVILPSGRYRLYLVAEGNVTIVLRLDGPAGSRRIRPSERVRSFIGTPQVQTSSGPLRNVYSVGESKRLTDRTLLFSTIWFDAVARTATAAGVCQYRGVPPEPSEIAYAPGCGDRGAISDDEVSGVDIPSAETRPFGFSRVYFGLSKGRWSHGMWYQSASVVQRSGSIFLWLPY